MSIGSVISTILDLALSGGKVVATVAKDAGVSSVTIGATKISVSAIITEIGTLSKIDFSSALDLSDFENAKTFLMSQQFPDDIVDIADILGAVGLVLPPVAVAANYVRYAAMAVTGVQAAVRIGTAFNLFADLVPDGHGGYVTQTWIDDPRHKLNPDGSFAN